MPTSETGDPQIKITVRGNCGTTHTFEEWASCPACKVRHTEASWAKDMLGQFTEKAGPST